MKKILYIHHGRGIGGAPLSLLFLIQKLDRSNYYPIVLCLYQSPAADLYRDEGIETCIAKGIHNFSHTYLTWYNYGRLGDLIWRSLAFLPSVYRTYRLVKTHKPDLVHLNSSTLAPCAIGAKLAGAPVVWHIREPIPSGYFGVRKWLLRRCIYMFADRVIAICQSDADQLINSDKIKVVYNFVDFNQFNKQIPGDGFRKEFGLDNGLKAIGMFGGVAITKGTLEFVKAAKMVKGRIEAAKFFVVGSLPTKLRPEPVEGLCPEPACPERSRRVEGVKAQDIKQGLKKVVKKILGVRDYYREIETVIESAGLGEDIIFTGVRQDIPGILAGMDLVIFPSTVPHFGRPIIEAGAMAKPVVASDLDGPRELVVDGETGLLVPAKNPKALAEAIIEILSDEQLAPRMGEAGYHRARRLFNREINARQTFEVYEELCT